MNKKGFTLVELLAVIIILGIILAIAVPRIMNVIANARLKSAENSAKLIMKAAINYYESTLLEGNPVITQFSYNNGVETSNVPGTSLNYSEKKPKNGYLIVNVNGSIIFSLYDGYHCIKTLSNSEEIDVYSTKRGDDCFWTGFY